MGILRQKGRQLITRIDATTIFKENILLLMICLIILIVLSIHLIFLTRYPPVFIDEPWYANMAWNWLTEGTNTDAIHAGARENVVLPYFGNLPLLASFALLGLGLIQARLVSWIFGVLLIVTTFVVGRYKYRAATGMVAGLLLALSPPYLQASHYVRPEIMLAFFGMVCYLFLQIGFKKDYWWAHLIAGLLISLSLDIHQNAIMYGLGITVLYLYYYGKAVFHKLGPRIFVLGGVLGIVYYLIFIVLPDPGNFVEFYRYSLISTNQPPISSLSVLNLLESIRAEIGRYHFYENNLDFAMIGASVVFLTIRRQKADRLLLLFMSTIFLGFVFLVGDKHDFYAILLYPFFVLAVSETLISLFYDIKGHAPQRAFTIILLGLVVVNGMIHLLRPLNQSRNYDYYAVTEEIKSVIPPDSRVMGLPNWWLGLSEYEYRSSFSLNYYSFLKGYTIEEGFEKIRPDFIIFDTGWNGVLVQTDNLSDEELGFFQMPRREFEDFLSSRGEKLFEFSNPWHGKFEIYLIHWDQS